MGNPIFTVLCFIVGFALFGIIPFLPDYMAGAKTIFVILILVIMGIGLAVAVKD